MVFKLAGQIKLLKLLFLMCLLWLDIQCGKVELTRKIYDNQIILYVLNLLSLETSDIYRAKLVFPTDYFHGYYTEFVFQRTQFVCDYVLPDIGSTVKMTMTCSYGIKIGQYPTSGII